MTTFFLQHFISSISFCYSFPKSAIPIKDWLGKIEGVIHQGEAGEVQEGKWREKFLTEGSIRGVIVSEEGNDIEIRLHTFASRSDQYLAAHMAWEAINMGATVENEGSDPIAAEDLGAEAVEATHSEWFGLSMRMLERMGDGGQLPIFGFLSLKKLNPVTVARMRRRWSGISSPASPDSGRRF